MTVSSLAVVPRGSGACNSDEIAPAVVVVAKISGVQGQKMSPWIKFPKTVTRGIPAGQIHVATRRRDTVGQPTNPCAVNRFFSMLFRPRIKS
jgi:hypothetical protein